jgi:hypothetical protein
MCKNETLTSGLSQVVPQNKVIKALYFQEIEENVKSKNVLSEVV